MLSLIVALGSNDSDLAGLAQQEIAQDLSPLIQQSIVSNSNLAVVTHVRFRQVYMIAPPMRSVPLFLLQERQPCLGIACTAKLRGDGHENCAVC